MALPTAIVTGMPEYRILMALFTGGLGNLKFAKALALYINNALLVKWGNGVQKVQNVEKSRHPPNNKN